MEKHEASYISRKKNYNIKVDKSNKEAIVELPEQYILQSFLDTDDDESEIWEFVSIKGYNVGKGQPIENPCLDPSGESVSKSSSDRDHPEVESIFADLHDKSGVPNALVTTDDSTLEKQEHTESSGKRRLSRKDQKPEVGGETGEGNRTRKRRKTRWTGDDSQLKLLGPIQLPSFVKDFVTSDMDPEIQELKVELFELNSKLQRPELHDDCPEEADRSPSPEPVYDSLGNRKNTRQVRLREKLIQKRHSIITRLIRKNSTLKPAADYKPPKLIKKLYIPEKEYPGYNFVGLIIGPRGSTQKRMEKETGAKILLRGKGYSFRMPSRMKASDNEDLHVRIEADNQDSLDAAVRMVEKLLIPTDQGTKAHKQAQLVELGELNGKKNKNMCRCCFDEGHPHYACPQLQSTFETWLACNVCGSTNHATPSCPLKASSQGSNSLYSRLEIGSTPGTQLKPNKETSDADLYVGYLPPTMDENRLAELFSPFGKIDKTKVIKDRATGISKGYGFVKFENPAHSALALSYMHGHKIDGKTLAVKEGTRQSNQSQDRYSVLSADPSHPAGSIAASEDAMLQTGWPGCYHNSKLTMFPETWRMTLPPPASCIPNLQGKSGLEYGYIATQVPFSSPCSLSQFPGVPNYPGCQFKSYIATQTSIPGSDLKPIP